jgi:hypothetical protein
MQRVWLWFAFGFVLLVGFGTVLPYFGSLQFLPGDLYDARLNIYFLEHGYKWVSGQTPHFWDAPFFYPVRHVLTYSDNLVGSLIFYAPWRWLGLDRETSFQIWALIGFLLNFAAAAYVLKKLAYRWGSVLAGAYVYAFSQVALTHLWHIQLHYRFAIPLAWYFLARFLERFSWLDLLRCAGFFVWQFYCSPYEGYFLALFLAAFTAVTAIREPVFTRYVQTTTARSALGQAGAVLAGVFALMPMLLPYWQGSHDADLIAGLRQETVNMLPRPVSYILSYTGNIETGTLYATVDLPLKHEHIMFVGLIPWVCVILSLMTARARGRKPSVTCAILGMFGVIALTLYVHGTSLYFLLMHFPAVAGMRAVTRSILILLLPFSLAVAQAVDLLQERLNGRLATAFLALLLGALALENHTTPYRFSKPDSRQRVASLVSRLPQRLPAQPVLAYLNPTPNVERELFELDAMLAAQERNIATVNGYSGREPKGYRPLRSCRDLELDLKDLPQSNDAFPLVHPETHLVTLGTPGDVPCSKINGAADFAYDQMLTHARRTVEDRVPAGGRVLVISKGDNELIQFDGRIGWHFPRAPNGAYAGYNPATSSAAIEHLESLREQGAEYLLVPRTAFWWLDYYTDLHSYMDARYTQVAADQDSVLYKLSSAGKAVTGFEGTLDVANANQISGWAWDSYLPDHPATVDVYDGATLVKSIAADQFRRDLLDAHKGNGKHAFQFAYKAESGGTHIIRATVSGRKFELVGSPATVKY